MIEVEALVVSNAEWIRNKARKYYVSASDADDLAGETIFKCLSCGRRFDSSRAFRPWVLAIMANTFITQYNRRKCVRFTGYDLEDVYVARQRADDLADIRSSLRIIRQCSRESAHIECVILYAKGYSYDEIAQLIGIPVGTVKSRVSAGRKLLRKALERE